MTGNPGVCTIYQARLHTDGSTSIYARLAYVTSGELLPDNFSPSACVIQRDFRSQRARAFLSFLFLQQKGGQRNVENEWTSIVQSRR